MDKIKELENKMAELSKELEELKSKQTDEWTPEQNEKYWFINDMGNIDSSVWWNDDGDNFKKDYLKIFKTREEAQEYLNYIKAKKEYSHEFTVEDWGKNDVFEYFITYDFGIKEFVIDWLLDCKEIGTTYFRTAKACKEFIDKYKKQILKYEFGIEVK